MAGTLSRGRRAARGRGHERRAPFGAGGGRAASDPLHGVIAFRRGRTFRLGSEARDGPPRARGGTIRDGVRTARGCRPSASRPGAARPVPVAPRRRRRAVRRRRSRPRSPGAARSGHQRAGGGRLAPLPRPALGVPGAAGRDGRRGASGRDRRRDGRAGRRVPRGQRALARGGRSQRPSRARGDRPHLPAGLPRLAPRGAVGPRPRRGGRLGRRRGRVRRGRDRGRRRPTGPACAPTGRGRSWRTGGPTPRRCC